MTGRKRIRHRESSKKAPRLEDLGRGEPTMAMNLYHRRFLDSYSSECLIRLFSRYRNAAKEITESWAMLEAAKKFVPDIDECVVVVVGDGCSPRTGALFAYYTKANVISIDPAMNLAHWNEHVENQTKIGFPPSRLRVVAGKAEDERIDVGGRKVVVVWPHSHADMDGIKLHNYSERVDIVMPCCVKIPSSWMSKIHISYEDQWVESPHKTIYVWMGGIPGVGQGREKS